MSRTTLNKTTPVCLPAHSGIRVSPRAFLRICRANPDLRLERRARGELVAMSPAGSESGKRNAELGLQLAAWNKRTRLGLVFDSSTGFTLPNGAIRSPDASWIARDRWTQLGPAQREGFAPICPDFVAELYSRSDSIKVVRSKMAEYLEQGARLGWLLNRQDGTVEIYRPGQAAEVLTRPGSLSGEDLLAGFVLDLQEILS